MKLLEAAKLAEGKTVINTVSCKTFSVVKGCMKTNDVITLGEYDEETWEVKLSERDIELAEVQDVLDKNGLLQDHLRDKWVLDSERLHNAIRMAVEQSFRRGMHVVRTKKV